MPARSFPFGASSAASGVAMALLLDDLDVAFLHQPRPLRGAVGDVLGELLGRARARLNAERDDLRLDLRYGDDPANIGVHFREDVGRRLRRRKYGTPGAALEARYATFGERWDVGEHLRALQLRLRNHADPAGLDHRLGVSHVVERDLGVARREARDRLGAALVVDDLVVGPGERLEQLVVQQ